MKLTFIKKINWTNHIIELLVVFLGITAGFVLQNDKEQNENKEFEQKYIVGFRDNVAENIESLQESIQHDSLWLAESTYALKLIATDSLSLDSANALIKTMIFYSEFSEQTTTYENILNSGNLNLIKDYDLKQKIVEYHKGLENFQLLETYFHDYFSEILMPFLMINFDLFSQKLIVSNIHKSILFKNIFGTHFSLTQQRHEGYKGLLDESMKMEGLLNNNLNE